MLNRAENLTSPSTITILLLAYAVVMFVREKIPLARTAIIVGIGGYSFRDYVKAGLPLIGVSFVICMVLLPILFPFFPG